MEFQNREEIRRDPADWYIIQGHGSVRAWDGETHPVGGTRGDAPEYLLVVTHIPIHRKRKNRRRGHLNQFFRMRHRKRAKQRGVNQRKHRRVGADSERERRHHHRGECRGLAQASQRISQILNGSFDHGQPSCLAVQFPGVLNAAEALHGVAAGLRRCQPALHAFLDQEVQVTGEFVIEFAVEFRSGKERFDFFPRGHIASTRAMTADSRSQFLVSDASCFSPALVIE
jgi:hypothetical protein